MEAFRQTSPFSAELFIMTNVPERIIACKSASNAQEQISPAHMIPIHSTLTEYGRALYRADISLLGVHSKIIFSPEFNVAILWACTGRKHKLAHMPTNVNQYLHSITV